MKTTRLLIADDHHVVREGIRMVFNSSPGYTIVAEAEDGEEAVALVEKHKPDAVIMDISMPKCNGIEATALIKQKNPGTKVIILTIHSDEEFVSEILRAGASGYLLKTAGKKEILAAVTSAISGERFFSPGISSIILESFIKRSNEHERQHPQSVTQNGAQQLTKREQEILQYIAQGYTNRKIAETLFLSVRTVNTHRTNLMQKLGIHDTARLVQFAIKKGFVKLDS